MNCKTAIFEINEGDRTVIGKYFSTLKQYKSDRKNRIVLVAKKDV